MRILTFLLAFVLANAPVMQALGPGFRLDPAHAVDSLLVLESTDRCTDNNGDPVSGCEIELYDAGTTDDLTSYSDAGLTTPLGAGDLTPIVSDSAGVFPDAYIGVDSYKIIIRNPATGIVKTRDNRPGAIDSSTFQTDFAREICPVLPKSSAYTVLIADLGKCIDANATGGAFDITLPSAITAGDGKEITVLKADASGNIVSVRTVSGQTIDGGTVAQLSTRNQTLRLVSNGANWRSIARAVVAAGSITSSELDASVSGRLTPIGTVIAYAGESCPAGWLEGDGSAVSRSTYEDLYNSYSNDGDDPGFYGDGDSTTTFNLPDYRGQFLRGHDNGAGSDPDAATRTDRGDGTTGDEVGTKQADEIEEFDVDDLMTDPGHVHTYDPGNSAITSGDITPQTAIRPNLGGGTTVNSSVTGITFDAIGGSETRPTNVSVLYCIFASSALAAGTFEQLNTILNGEGTPSSGDGNNGDVFLDTFNQDYYVKTSGSWVLQSSLVGPSTGHEFKWDTGTSDTDPGDGLIAANNATLSSVTALYVDDEDKGGSDISADVLAWDDSDSATRGQIKITSLDDRTNWARYDLTGASTDNSGYVALALTYVDHAGSFTDNDPVAVTFSRTGDKGEDGLPGPTVANLWNFDSTTSDADPGSGEFRLNNAAPASATEAYFDDNEAGGSSISAWVDTWDDNGTSADRGQILVIDPADATIFHRYTVTGTVTDGTGYRKVTLSHVAGNGSLTNGEPYAVQFVARGSSGDDGEGTGDVVGPASSTDDNLAAFDGATGKLLKDSGKATPSGDIVGTTDTQTLTNKTYQGGTIVNGVGGTYAVTDQGTKSTGTFTPDPSDGFMQKAVNNGAHTLAATAETGAFRLVYTNGASAGTITASGFDEVFDTDTALEHTVENSIIEIIVVNDGVAKVATVTLITDATP